MKLYLQKREKRVIKRQFILAVLLMFALQLLPTQAIESEISDNSSILKADFTTHSRYAIFKNGEPVSLKISLEGQRAAADTLEWWVTNYLDEETDKGELSVPAGDDSWTTVLPLKNYGAGYFEVHLNMKKSGVTLDKRGTRPAGIVAYGVLSDITALPLEHPDDSRFGAQGTNYLKADENRKGNMDPLDPIYPLLGAKWVYLNKQLGMIFGKGVDSWEPHLDPEYFKNGRNYAAKAGCAILVDLHSIPQWLWKVTPGANTKGNRTQAGQRFAPKDMNAYKKMVAKVVREQVMRQKICFPTMAHNYYQIHWEPDWHWKGTDEEFIGMYQAAYEVIHENDPKGLLLGPNYGVLRKGNKLLKSLFEKGLGKYMDGVLLHTYYMNMEGRKSLPDDVKEVVEMTRQYLSPDAKIMNTEWGTNWPKPPEEDPEALRKEAASFMTGHLIALGEGVDSTWFFYTGDTGKHGGGLLYNLSLDKFTFGATHVAPKPVFMAAAVATRLLEGTKSLGRIDYLDRGVLGYAFDRNGTNVVCLWSEDKQPRSVKLPVGKVKNITLVDSMGNSQMIDVSGGLVDADISAIPSWIIGVESNTLPFSKKKILKVFPNSKISLKNHGNYYILMNNKWVKAGKKGKLEVPGNTAEGRKLVGIFDGRKRNLIETFLIDVNPSLNISLNKTIRPGLLTLDLKNNQTKTVSGIIKLIADKKTVSEKRVFLEPYQRKELVFDIRNIDSGTKTKVEFVDENGAECTFYPPSLKKLIPAHRCLTKLQIDADLNDWLLEMFNSVGETRKSELSNQMNVRLAAQYDNKFLYLALKIMEQDHIQTQHPTGLWHQDSIQIGLAVHPNGQQWQSWQKFGIGENSVHGFQMAYRDLGNAFPIGNMQKSEITWAFSHSGDESFYEIRIPWSKVGKGLDGPPEDGVVGLGVMVNNVELTSDGKPGHRQNIDVMGGMNLSRPEDFGMLELK